MNEGFLKGIEAFKLRFKQCRPIRGIYKTDDGQEWVILNEGTVIKRNELCI